MGPRGYGHFCPHSPPPRTLLPHTHSAESDSHSVWPFPRSSRSRKGSRKLARGRAKRQPRVHSSHRHSTPEGVAEAAYHAGHFPGFQHPCRGANRGMADRFPGCSSLPLLDPGLISRIPLGWNTIVTTFSNLLSSAPPPPRSEILWPERAVPASMLQNDNEEKYRIPTGSINSPSHWVVGHDYWNKARKRSWEG